MDDASPATSPHDHLISLIIPAADAGQFFAQLRQIEIELADVPHEIIAVYDDDADALLAADAMPNRPRSLRLIHQGAAPLLATGSRAAAGDVIVPLAPGDPLAHVSALAGLIRREHCAIAIATVPRGGGFLGWADFLLAAVAGMNAWNPITGLRAYSADFLDRQSPQAFDPPALALELAIKAQFQHQPIASLHIPGLVVTPSARPSTANAAHVLFPGLRDALLAPLLVHGVWILMTLAAVITLVAAHKPLALGQFADIALPAAAVFAFTLAVRRIRGRVRLADAFFSLVLLNPLLFAARDWGPFDPTLLAIGLLGLMSGAIIAMKHDALRRYLAVAVLALILTALSAKFAMLLPALAVWLLLAGYSLARTPGDVLPARRRRLRGYFIFAAGEAALFIFGLVCILAPSVATSAPATLFPTIVGLSEFPLLVLAILMLALGWRPARPRRIVEGARLSSKLRTPTNPGVPAPRGIMPHAAPASFFSSAPPHFAGTLALLLGLLTLLLNNVEPGGRGIAPPGADVTTTILCLLYTVSALHGPRRLHWILPPLLLIFAIAYTFFRPMP